MKHWKKNRYPGDAIDQAMRQLAHTLLEGKQVKALAIVVIDNDGLAHGNVSMRGVGLAPSPEAGALQRQLAERLFEYQNTLL